MKYTSDHLHIPWKELNSWFKPVKQADGSVVQRLSLDEPFRLVGKDQKIVDLDNTLDAYILAPQCPENTYWESESIYQLIQKVCKENPSIDTNRIYLTGLSMGAWGAWNLAFAHPEMFAAC